MRCNETCMTGDGCTCQPKHVHAVDALVNGKFTRSIITPEWRALVLSEPDDIGGEPVFGEAV